LTLKQGIIPGSSTLAQPLDARINRQFKQMLRHSCDRVRHRNPEFTIFVRKNLAALLSFVHRQFGAPAPESQMRKVNRRRNGRSLSLMDGVPFANCELLANFQRTVRDDPFLLIIHRSQR
jgi:hypothetical protein